MVNNPIKHTVQCDLCHKEFHITKEVLKEERATLHQGSLEPHEVLLTYLHCPICGKRYPVIMDDDTTLPLLEKLHSVLVKVTRQVQKGFTANPRLRQKQQELNRKLNFKRQKLAEKYNGSIYQLENGLWEQLDYRYHAR